MLGLFKRKKQTNTFDQVFKDHQEFVRRLAYSISGSDAEAQDITQEVFIAIYQSLDSFRGDSKISTWIYRITVRLAGQHLSRKRPYIELEDAHQCQSPKPEDMTVTDSQLIKAMQKLTLEQRTLLSLIAINGLSHTHVAEILGVPAGTIGSRLFTAREKLAKALKHH